MHDAVNMVYQIASYLIAVCAVYLVINDIWNDPNTPLVPGLSKQRTSLSNQILTDGTR